MDPQQIIAFSLINFIHITAIIIINNNNGIDNRPASCAIALRTTTSISATSEKVLSREIYSTDFIKISMKTKSYCYLPGREMNALTPRNPNWGSATARVRAEARMMIVFIFSSAVPVAQKKEE